MKSIFEYSDYRQFLRDYYANAKAKNPHFSFRFFSKAAGFKSGNNLKIVMDGKRNIALHSISKFTKALKLNKQESAFFKNLVLFNQAENHEEKRRHAEELLRSRKYREIRPLGQDQYDYFSNWFYTVVQEMVYLPAFKEDPKWIAEHFTSQISPEDVQAALKVLTRLGLVTRNDKGRLVQAQGHLTTPDEVASSAIAAYHREMMKRASESIELVKREKREISAISMVLGDESMRQIKEKIQNFRREVTEIAAAEKAPKSVYQLNFQLFPLAETGENEGEKS